MPKEEKVELEGEVVEALPNAMFRVKLDNMDRVVLGHVAGKMRRFRIRILPGDRVRVELSPTTWIAPGSSTATADAAPRGGAGTRADRGTGAGPGSGRTADACAGWVTTPPWCAPAATRSPRLDTMVDGVHFRREQLSAEEIGHRALAAALSDLAAMAADPGEAYLSLALAPGIELPEAASAGPSGSGRGQALRDARSPAATSPPPAS